MRFVFPVCLGLVLAAALFTAVALLLTRLDLVRFLKAVAAGRFEVACVSRKADSRFRTIEISGTAGQERFVLSVLLDAAADRARYRLRLSGPWTFKRSCRLHDIGEPFARAHRHLLHEDRPRRATAPGSPGKDAA